MRRKKIVIAVAVIAGLPLLLLAAAVLYLSLVDLGAFRPDVERLLTDALGREVRIAGRFEPRIALIATVEAGDVSLANPSWSPSPDMVAVDRLAVRLDLLSLLFGPVRIEEIEARGVRVLLEANAEGRANWEFATAGEKRGPASPGVVLERVFIEDAELTYRDPSVDRPLAIAVTRLEIVSGEAGMQDLRLDGRSSGVPIELEGRLGPQAGLFAGGSVETELSGRLGDTQLTLRGRVESLATLVGADLEADLHGPDLAALASLLGLPHLGEGPFRVAASVSSVGEGSALTLDALAGGIRAEGRGRMDSLLRPRRLDVTIDASGPDAAALGALAGIKALPTEPFSASGRVRWAGFPIAFEKVELRVGENRLSVDGVLGPPPRMHGTDFRFEGSGPDAAALGALARVDLPAERFEIRGRLIRREDGIEAEQIEARIGPATLEVDGLLGDPPGYPGSDLRVRAAGPDLSLFSAIARRTLPAESFEVEGRLNPGERGLSLRGVRARVGPDTMSVEGRLGTAKDWLGTDIRLVAGGPDPSLLAGLAGITDLPPEPYRVEGGLRILADGYWLDEVAGTLGDRSVWIDGRVGPGAGSIHTDLRVRLEGEDLSRTAPLVGLADSPAVPYRAAGRLTIDETGYLLDEMNGVLGDVELEAEGRIGADAGLEGTDLRVTVRGPRASALDPWLGRVLLPADPFEVSGAVRTRDGLHLLDGVVIDLGPDRLTVNGTLAPVKGLAGSELELELSGPSLARLGRLASSAGLATVPELPDQSYSAAGGVKVHADGYDLRSVQLGLGPAHARLDGHLGSPPELVGTDLTFEFDGPDTALFLALTGVTAPVGPFLGRGRIERPGTGLRFHDLSIRVGEYRAWADGFLGEPPELAGTDLDLRAKGPDLALLQQLAGLPELPDEPFELSAHFLGTPREFSVERLAARVGESDLAGSLRADLRGKPDVHGELQSSQLDLTALLGLDATAVEPADDAAPAGRPTDEPVEPATARAGSGRARLLSDEPFDTGPLQAADADIRWNIASATLPHLRLADVRIDLRLRDGNLTLDPMVAVGENGGRLEAALTLSPEEPGVRFETRADLRGARIDLTNFEDDPAGWPSVDVEVELSGAGGSPRGVAAGTTGRIIVVAGQGAMDRSILDSLATPIFQTLRDTFHPFTRERPNSRLDCAVMALSIEDGRLSLDPLVARTDRMTILASGRINLQTEKINFDWVLKQRKGIGVGASTFTNPYIKLGGTLAAPTVEVKPLRAATATGAAVATGGLSLLYTSLWGRITSGRDVCKQALEAMHRPGGEKNGRSAATP